jgi:hypothetical protein
MSLANAEAMREMMLRAVDGLASEPECFAEAPPADVFVG